MIMANLATSHVQKKGGNYVLTDADGSTEVLTLEQYATRRRQKPVKPALPGRVEKPTRN
jgi:hypothetical protein